MVREARVQVDGGCQRPARVGGRPACSDGRGPATIINAQIDPLRDDGAKYAAALKKAGVKVNHVSYDGVSHEFFGMGAVLDKAKAAQKVVADDLKASFKSR